MCNVWTKVATKRPNVHCHWTKMLHFYYAPTLGGYFGTAWSVRLLPVRLSVPWRSCLGYMHAGCLHQPPPATRGCGLLTRPRMDVDPPQFCRYWWPDWRQNDMPPWNCHRRGHVVSLPPGRYLVIYRQKMKVGKHYSQSEGRQQLTAVVNWKS